MCGQSAQKHVVGYWQAGFFAAFIGVLNHLAWCKDTNMTPVINWNNAIYYQAEGYNNSKDAWEYYFEPVSTLKYTPGDFVNSHFYAGQSIYFTGWTVDHFSRAKAYYLIKNYIKVNAIVQKKIDDFYNEHMKGKRTIGIHLRGTDKHTEEPQVPVEKILEIANSFADGQTQFFVASDDIRLFNKAKEILKGRVLSIDAFRIATEQFFWVAYQSNKAKLCEEVIIDCQLLSRCEKMIHTFSSVSTAALFFNPWLDNILLTNR